jgi:hypothetical protein
MSKSIKLGDIRILEEQEPDLFGRLSRNIDLDNPAFHSPEFRAALQDTRRRIFDTLRTFLARTEEDRKIREIFIKVAENGGSFWNHSGPDIIRYKTNVRNHPERALPNELVKAAVIADIKKHSSRRGDPRENTFGADHVLGMPVHAALWQDPDVQQAFLYACI